MVIILIRYRRILLSQNCVYIRKSLRIHLSSLWSQGPRPEAGGGARERFNNEVSDNCGNSTRSEIIVLIFIVIKVVYPLSTDLVFLV